MQGLVAGPEESDWSVDGVSDDAQQAHVLKHRESGACVAKPSHKAQDPSEDRSQPGAGWGGPVVTAPGLPGTPAGSRVTAWRPNHSDPHFLREQNRKSILGFCE